MIRTVKPKNARAKRALVKREAKLVENVKQALFIPGQSCNKNLHDIMVDLSALKKPDMKRFNRKNDIHPFEDMSPLEFFSEKNDCSLMVLMTSSKKRKNNMTFIRTFGYKIYDMIELMVTDNFKLLSDFKKLTFTVGLKPMFTFQGAAFDTHPVYKQIKSLFLDFFRGESTDLQDVAGLQHVISMTIQGDFQDGEPLPNVLFRVYKLKSYKSDQGGKRLPRIELVEIGPRLDFKIGRIHTPSPDMVTEAHKKPKQLEMKTKKNVELDIMGDKLGRIHMGKQDLGKLQTRKMKGLKSKFDQGTEEGDGEVDEDYEDEASYSDDGQEYEEEFVSATDIEPSAKRQKK
ncbi:rRNA-binding ribosome biosynthesis protein rpf2 [Saccharomyces cerevisiae]|nr:ALH_1c_G0034280.mRNA.1.CDS.1 [Saccharomyces cerevisiae]CAI5313611.1 AKR_HP2_G0032980.mRNA.1.CDS.1 [Saccharomyces cerevisiae]CAI6694527.1 AKR_HP2_G0032980.mRNA.1.CDS.1 [Saccharomyces cerevisiae]CAI6709030.1 AKR_HP1_G0033320.mRNA.1.CDS.1 [Saccharomyces cerevisiae]CAI6782649.1 ALH_1c_G0034280.mRNA.1.CDS.1 [Saccharomyces cerevisiae]